VARQAGAAVKWLLCYLRLAAQSHINCWAAISAGEWYTSNIVESDRK